jgi:arylsulfatase A-like enzyme
MDLAASILAATGTPVPPAARLDGIDLFPILEGRTPPVDRTLFWRVRTGGFDQRAVRSGDMKLLIDGLVRPMLFNVRKDVGEREDLTQQQTAVVRRLRQQLLAWEKEVDAEAKVGGRNLPKQ